MKALWVLTCLNSLYPVLSYHGVQIFQAEGGNVKLGCSTPGDIPIDPLENVKPNQRQQDARFELIPKKSEQLTLVTDAARSFVEVTKVAHSEMLQDENDPVDTTPEEARLLKRFPSLYLQVSRCCAHWLMMKYLTNSRKQKLNI